MSIVGGVQPMQYYPPSYRSIQISTEGSSPMVFAPISVTSQSRIPSPYARLPDDTPNRWDLPNFEPHSQHDGKAASEAGAILIAGGGLAMLVAIAVKLTQDARRISTPEAVPRSEAPERASVPNPDTQPPQHPFATAPMALTAPTEFAARLAPPTISSLLEKSEFKMERFLGQQDYTDTIELADLISREAFHLSQGTTSDCALFASRAALGGLGRFSGQRSLYGALAERINNSPGNHYLSADDLMVWHNMQVDRINQSLAPGATRLHRVHAGNFSFNLGIDAQRRGTIGGMLRSQDALVATIAASLRMSGVPDVIDHLMVPTRLVRIGTVEQARAGQDVTGGHVETHWIALRYLPLRGGGWYEVDSLRSDVPRITGPGAVADVNGAARALAAHIAKHLSSSINSEDHTTATFALPVLHPIR